MSEGKTVASNQLAKMEVISHVFYTLMLN